MIWLLALPLAAAGVHVADYIADSLVAKKRIKEAVKPDEDLTVIEKLAFTNADLEKINSGTASPKEVLIILKEAEARGASCEHLNLKAQKAA